MDRFLTMKVLSHTIQTIALLASLLRLIHASKVHVVSSFIESKIVYVRQPMNLYLSIKTFC